MEENFYEELKCFFALPKLHVVPTGVDAGRPYLLLLRSLGPCSADTWWSVSVHLHSTLETPQDWCKTKGAAGNAP